MTELKKILITLAEFIVCFLIFDFGIGIFLDWSIKQLPSDGERVAKSEYVMNKVKAEFVVIGSSRAEAHYDSRVLMDSFPEYTIFNCGVDGQLFYYINTTFNSIMDRYTPKIVVWDFQTKDLVDNEPENLSLLYPYYYTNQRVKEVLNEQDRDLKYLLWINCYRYNGTGSRILRAVKMQESNNAGFSSHSSTDSTRKIVSCQTGRNEKLNIEKVNILDATLARAKKNGIKMVLCVSPMYSNITCPSTTIEQLNKLAKKYNFLFIDDSQIEQFINSNEYWYDGGHLNTKGADIFTKILSKQIKENI